MEILYRKLADLDLSIRTKNILKNAGIETLQELTAYTKSDLIKFRNFGTRSIMELEELMLSNNLNFGMGQTIKSDNTETLTNALCQIQNLEALKELTDFLQWVFRKIDKGDTPKEIVRILLMNRDKIDNIKFELTLIQKHKQ